VNLLDAARAAKEAQRRRLGAALTGTGATSAVPAAGERPIRRGSLDGGARMPVPIARDPVLAHDELVVAMARVAGTFRRGFYSPRTNW